MVDLASLILAVTVCPDKSILGSIDANQSNISSVQKTANYNSAKIAQAQKALDGKANSSDITSLSGRIDTNQSNISSVQKTANDNSAKITQAQQDIIALQSATSNLSGYETTADAGTLADRITALENKKPIRAWSQNDAVAKSQSSNNEYYW